MAALNERVDALYAKAVALQEKLGFELKVPRLVAVGAESAGKTSLIEYLVGFNVAFKKRGTATRCPTMLTLRRDVTMEKGQRHILLNGQSVKAEDLASRVERHMHSLGDKFDDTPVDIHVRSAEVRDLVLFDLPGLICNPGKDKQQQDNALQIKRIVARYVRNPQNMLLVVSKCQERVSSLTEVQLIGDLATDPFDSMPPRPDWKHSAVFLVNFLNIHLPQFKDASEANEFFEEARQATDAKYFFVSLRPTKATDIDKMTLRESEKFYSELPEEEQKFYKSKVEELDTAQAWDPRNYDIMGVEKAVTAVQMLLRESFAQSFPELADKVATEERNLNDTISDLMRRKAALDPFLAKAAVRQFLVDFMEHFQRSIQGQEARSLTALARSTIYNSRDYGRTFEEDCLYAPLSEMQGGAISLEELWSDEHLGGRTLGEDMDRRLLGLAAFQRAIAIFEYIVLKRELQNCTDDDFRNAAHTGGRSQSHFPSNDVVMQMAVRQLSEAAGGITWLCKLLRGHETYHAEAVCKTLLKSNHYAVHDSDLLLDAIVSRFDKLLETRLQVVIERCQHFVGTCDTYRPVDTMRKLYMLLPMLGLETMMPSMDMVQPRDEEATRLHSGRLYGMVQESIERNRQLTDYYTFADVISPGMQQVCPQDPNMVDYDYLRRCTTGHYRLYAVFFVDQFQREFQMEFGNYLTSPDPEGLAKDIEKLRVEVEDVIVKGFTEATDQATPEELEAQLEDAKAKLDELTKVRKSMEKEPGFKFPRRARDAPAAAAEQVPATASGRPKRTSFFSISDSAEAPRRGLASARPRKDVPGRQPAAQPQRLREQRQEPATQVQAPRENGGWGFAEQAAATVLVAGCASALWVWQRRR